MKIIDSFVNSLLYVAYMIGACASSAIIDILALKVLNEFVIVSLFVQTIIRVVIYAIAPLVVLGIVSYKEGYREARFKALESIISCVFAIFGTFIVSLLFHFDRFVAGGVKYISALIAYGDKLYDAVQIANIGYRYAIPVFVALFVIYSLVITIGKKLGADKRICDRAELTHKNEA